MHPYCNVKYHLLYHVRGITSWLDAVKRICNVVMPLKVIKRSMGLEPSASKLTVEALETSIATTYIHTSFY